MTTAAMLTAIQAALAADAPLVRWCLEQFDRPPTVQIDFDKDEIHGDRRSPEGFPLIAILAIAHESQIQQRANFYTVSLVAVVRDRDSTTSTQAITIDGKTINVPLRTWPGRLAAETLRELATAALYRAQLGKVSQDSDTLSQTYHPMFYSPFTITIEERI